MSTVGTAHTKVHKTLPDLAIMHRWKLLTVPGICHLQVQDWTAAFVRAGRGESFVAAVGELDRESRGGH